MCLIGLKISDSSGVDLILANRDELYERPTLPAHYWEEAPHLLAGKDLRKGGTWLGVTLDGRFAALANLRIKGRRKLYPEELSRGEWVLRFLKKNSSTHQNREELLKAYIGEVENLKKNYPPFHMILGYLYGPIYYLSFLEPPKKIMPGIFVISNTPLKEPLPKMQILTEWLENHPHPSLEEGFQILGSPIPRPAHSSSISPVSIEELTLPIFVLSPSYGTRSSTVIQNQGKGEFCFQEKSFDSQGRISSFVSFKLILRKKDTH